MSVSLPPVPVPSDDEEDQVSEDSKANEESGDTWPDVDEGEEEEAEEAEAEAEGEEEEGEADNEEDEEEDEEDVLDDVEKLDEFRSFKEHTLGWLKQCYPSNVAGGLVHNILRSNVETRALVRYFYYNVYRFLPDPPEDV